MHFVLESRLYTNTDQNDTQVATSETQEVSQKFEELGSGQFLITNDIIQPHYGYNVQGHNSGSGSDGIVCRWTSSSNGECAWTLKEITDQDLLNTLLNKVLTKTLDDAIQAAESTRNKVIDHAALITNVDQLSTNNSEGVSKRRILFFYSESPDFLKPGLCYFLKYLYL